MIAAIILPRRVTSTGSLPKAARLIVCERLSACGMGSKTGAGSRDNACENAETYVTAGWRDMVRRGKGRAKERT